MPSPDPDFRAELAAMQRIVKLLNGFDSDTQARILTWVTDRYATYDDTSPDGNVDDDPA